MRGLRAAEIGIPVLMLTARAQIEERVEDLDSGADDYLPKPSFAGLLARVRALTRRPQGKADEQDIRVGDLTLDPVRHMVRRGSERIDLGAKEFALLAALLRRPGQVFTRSVLLETSASLGLPATGLARQAIDEEERSAATVDGPDGSMRVVSIPVLRSGTVVGVA